MSQSGSLYVVATPIGNLADITQRALECLRTVDVIAAEDTRQVAKLLNHFTIQTHVISLFEHNERRQMDNLITRMLRGENVALVSDAGTPLISDPGRHLIMACHEAHIQVIPLPGPSSLTAALSVAGFPADQFVFAGFLAATPTQRRKELEKLKRETRTVVIFEAPHRILATLKDLVEIIGPERKAVVAKELTKVFETVRHDELQHLLNWIKSDAQLQKGEFVVILGPCKMHELDTDDENILRILTVLLLELPAKQAIHLTSKLTGARKNHVYQLHLKNQSENNSSSDE